MAPRRITVCSKLLLSGEYAVLRPHGMAVAVPAAPHVVVHARPAATVSLAVPDVSPAVSDVSGSMPGAARGAGLLSEIVRRCVEALAGWAEEAGLKDEAAAVRRGVCVRMGRGNEDGPVRLRRGGEGGPVRLVRGGEGGPVRLRRRNSVAEPSMWGYGVTGTGRSAGLAVATVALCARLAGIAVTRQELFRVAAAGHGLAQGGGSGVDVAAITFAAPVLYCRGSEPLPWEAATGRGLWRPCLEWPVVEAGGKGKRLPRFLAASTGVKAETAALLARFSAASGTPRFERALERHAELSNRLSRALWGRDADADTGEPVALGRLVSDVQESLRKVDEAARIGIYTPEVEGLLAAAQRCRVAAKVSGAGGGDSVVAFPADADEAARLAHAWKLSGSAAV